jgi:hypothetical protein
LIGLSFVAFVDILGFGDMVLRDCESATPGEIHLPNLKAAIHSSLGSAEAVEARITQFSDSIVIASPFYAQQDKLLAFLSLVADLQRSLFDRDILCRGGVSHGRHFHDDILLFSQGLIEAYRLESHVAQDPRIVVSTETIDLLFPDGIKENVVLLDADGVSFLNFLRESSREEIEERLASFRHNLTSENSRIRGKTAWVFRYANHLYPEIILPAEITMRACH